jgi:hypothetical protein
VRSAPGTNQSQAPGGGCSLASGEGSVCFYPPGSVEEHLVTEHGIDSLDVRRHAKGHHDHAREHSRQTSMHLAAVGDPIAVGHAHQEAA